MVLSLVLGTMVIALLVIGVFLAIAYRRVVPTNMVHIVQAKKSTIAYGRGKDAGNTYYAWPSWVPVIGVSVIELPESIFQVHLGDYEAYDQARLPFVVDVTAFFRIEKAEMAAQRVANFAELRSGLQAVLQGAVRRILATNELEKILQSRSELGEQFTKEVQEQIAEWGVLPVKSIEFMDLRDSPKGTVIADIMAKEQSRIAMQSTVEVANNKRTAELAVINANREIEVQRQDAEQKIGERTAEKEKQVGIANEQSRQEVLASARLTAERQMAVSQVEQVKAAEIAKEVASVKAEQDKQVMVINAQAAKQAQVTAAEGDLEAAKREADGTRALGEARAAAEQALLMAPVTAQINLAREIGANPAYQTYLVSIEQVQANKAVGVAMADSLKTADLKIIANSGDVASGMTKFGEALGTSGGTKLAGFLSALSQTPEGQQVLNGMTGKPSLAAAVGAGVTAATGNTTAGALAAGAVLHADGESSIHKQP